MTITSTPTPRYACESCHLRALCLPDHISLSAGEEKLQRLVTALPPRPRGSYLYREGTLRQSFFFLRSGSAKAVVADEQGGECVTGFYFPTEIIGAPSLEHDNYTESVQLLERSAVCEVSAATLEELCATEPELLHRLFLKLAGSFDIERHARLRVSRASVHARVVDFLAETDRRLQVLGFPPGEFVLPMTRYDIANHIGVAAETVSRAFRRLADEGLIALRGRHVTVRAPGGLQKWLNERGGAATLTGRRLPGGRSRMLKGREN